MKDPNFIHADDNTKKMIIDAFAKTHIQQIETEKETVMKENLALKEHIAGLELNYATNPSKIDVKQHSTVSYQIPNPNWNDEQIEEFTYILIKNLEGRHITKEVIKEVSITSNKGCIKLGNFQAISRRSG